MLFDYASLYTQWGLFYVLVKYWGFIKLVWYNVAKFVLVAKFPVADYAICSYQRFAGRGVSSPILQTFIRASHAFQSPLLDNQNEFSRNISQRRSTIYQRTLLWFMWHIKVQNEFIFSSQLSFLMFFFFITIIKIKIRALEQRCLYTEWMLTLPTSRQLIPLLHSNHNNLQPNAFDQLPIKEKKL